MRNADIWQPSKAEQRNGRWRPSRDPKQLSAGSRAVAEWMIAAYEDAIATHARGVLADIGCGKAPYYGMYRDRVSEIVTVDWDSGLHGDHHVDVFSDLNQRIDLDAAAVDTALCADVLEHLYEPRIFAAEIARVLRPGGKLIIGVPFYYWIHEAPHDYHRYTRFALQRLIEDAGMQLVSLEPIGGLPHVMTDLMCKAAHKSPFVADTVRIAATSALRWQPLARAARRSADSFPLAYMLVAQKPAAA